MNTKPGNGRQTILVVDDEFGIRDFLYAYLKTKNFRVLTAASGEEALRIWDSEEGKIDILLTDMLMPGMNGKALADEIEKKDGAAKIIFMSGYTPQENVATELNHPLLRKPFLPNELLQAIREVSHK